MNELRKYLVGIGLVITVIGALLWLGIGKGWPELCEAGRFFMRCTADAKRV